MKADLHMHSTASDGQYSPEEVVRLAHAAGTELMALTDHDSAAGVMRAAKEAEKVDVKLLAGVELGCSGPGTKEIHILGYGIDPMHPAFVAHTREKAERRTARAEEMVRQLCAAGKVISMERVREMGTGNVSRTHIARELVEEGHASSVKDAFDRYLKPGKCGYVPRPEFRVSEAARLISEVGGVTVLAHPMEMGMSEMNLEALVHEWKTQGLAGMEVYHPSTGNQHLPFLLGLAKREGLLVTGGSDFHGERVNEKRMRQGLERWVTMDDDAQALLAAIDGLRKG